MTRDIRRNLMNTAAMKLDIPFSDFIIDAIAKEIEQIPNEHWYWCTFRNSYLLCPYGNRVIDNKEGIDWQDFAADCYQLKNFCNDFIFPMCTVRPRVVITRTFPGMKMKQHVDCVEHEMNDIQPKLRVVLKGRQNNTLYYLNEAGERVHIPEHWRAYIMSGHAMHGMDNNGEEKLTLCFGAPWIGDNLENERFVDYMISQFRLNSKSAITISELGKVDYSDGIRDPEKYKMVPWNEWNNIAN